MILTKLFSNRSKRAESFVVVRRAESRPTVSVTVAQADSCQSQIDRVVQNIESGEVRETMNIVFQHLLRLLDCLRLIERYLREVEAAEETLALFLLIHDDANRLVEFITADALSCNGMSEELVDTLDGVTFAVSHDLKRVFETDWKAAISDKASNVVGRLYRAHDVLTNCLQQSTITLAMVFDPEFVGTRLFNNSNMRYRQSVQLCEDLSTLIQLVENAEEREVEPALSSLTAGIENFRNESMEFLMYSDWPQFEEFCERVMLSLVDLPQQKPVLHQFRCYLETLLGQVRMRAVLASVSPVRFGADDSVKLPASAGQKPMAFSPSFDLEDDQTEWNTLAIAV